MKKKDKLNKILATVKKYHLDYVLAIAGGAALGAYAYDRYMDAGDFVSISVGSAIVDGEPGCYARILKMWSNGKETPVMKLLFSEDGWDKFVQNMAEVLKEAKNE